MSTTVQELVFLIRIAEFEKNTHIKKSFYFSDIRIKFLLSKLGFLF